MRVDNIQHTELTTQGKLVVDEIPFGTTAAWRFS